MARHPEQERESEEPEEDLRPSRTSERRERKESEEGLARLSIELCGVSERRLAGLGLPEALEVAVREARRIPSPAARNRALRRVRQELRNGDWAAVAARLRADGAPRNAPSALAADAVAVWCARLVNEGDSAIDALVTAHPNAHRKELRILLRNLTQMTPSRVSRARQALERVVRGLLRGSGPPLRPIVVKALDAERADR